MFWNDAVVSKEFPQSYGEILTVVWTNSVSIFIPTGKKPHHLIICTCAFTQQCSTERFPFTAWILVVRIKGILHSGRGISAIFAKLVHETTIRDKMVFRFVAEAIKRVADIDATAATARWSQTCWVPVYFKLSTCRVVVTVVVNYWFTHFVRITCTAVAARRAAMGPVPSFAVEAITAALRGSVGTAASSAAGGNCAAAKAYEQ